MNALRWLTKEIKEEWSDIASKRMKRFILVISGCLILTYILTLFHLIIIAIPFIAIIISWGGYEIRELGGLERWIKEAQEAVDRWIKEYGVRYFSELTNMAVLTEEVGELARVMARKYGDQSFKPGEKDNLGEEMADILWVLLCLANQTGVDLTAELEKSIEKKTQRDSLRHIQNKKLMA